ncbi:YceD family protein [Gloeobacter violaceus]|uniref:Glr2233 protein n=1 Tax=Gloeobacter violaceus (strain ATCC 29082 / PCC 7421) TaxID=251221 RepID=Q7NIF0_GLOVI|nr:DUF177 domain-containing protein [Gloeobacter violaceus]BAC90174.1 glr2233 [Gloeobacter violaceus PCC 7421]
MLRSIELRALAASPTRNLTIVIDEPIAALPSLTPVQGELAVVHHGDFLEVTGRAQTIVTLACDRCLQHFNHRLVTDFEEVIWLEDASVEVPLELEVPPAHLDELLPRDGRLDPVDLIYQHLCLELPVRNLCSEQCQGVKTAQPEEQSLDRRWAALARLREELG